MCPWELLPSPPVTEGPAMPPPPPLVFMPDDLQVGVWAHGVTPSANPNEIILDFVPWTGQAAVADEQGQQAVQQQYRVVSRVRLPPAQMFEIMKMLSNLLSQLSGRKGSAPFPVQELRRLLSSRPTMRGIMEPMQEGPHEYDNRDDSTCYVGQSDAIRRQCAGQGDDVQRRGSAAGHR